MKSRYRVASGDSWGTDIGSGQARRMAYTLTARVLRLVVAGLTGVVIARLLQPAGIGAYYLVVTVATTTVALGHLSVEQSQIWLWAWPENRSVLSANSVLLGMTMGTVAALVAGVLVAGLGGNALPVSGYGHLAVALAATPFAMTVLYVNNILVLRSRVDLVNWSTVFGTAVQCGSLLLLVLAGVRPSVGLVVGLWTVSMSVPLVLLVPAVRPRFRDHDLSLLRRALTRGSRYHTGSASLFLLTRVDILILNALAPSAAVGAYALAVTLADLARISTDVLSQVVLPRQVESEHLDAVDLTIKTTRICILLAVGSSALICVAAPFVVPVVYGAAYAGSVPPVLGLAPGLLAFGVARSIVTFLVRLNRPLTTSAMSVAALMLNVFLNLTLIPRFGIMGCAIASSVSYIILSAMQCIWFLRATQTPCRMLLPWADGRRGIVRRI